MLSNAGMYVRFGGGNHSKKMCKSPGLISDFRGWSSPKQPPKKIWSCYFSNEHIWRTRHIFLSQSDRMKLPSWGTFACNYIAHLTFPDQVIRHEIQVPTYNKTDYIFIAKISFNSSLGFLLKNALSSQLMATYYCSTKNVARGKHSNSSYCNNLFLLLM